MSSPKLSHTKPVVMKNSILNHLVKYFPHDIVDFEDVFAMLKNCPFEHWEARYILFLWCSVYVINPFDLKDVINVPSLIFMSMEALQESGKPRDGSIILLSRLLTRPDMQSELGEFFTITMDTINKSTHVYQKIGILNTLDEIFKIGDVEKIKEFCPPLLEISCAKVVENNSMITRLYMKICRRIALALLKSRRLKWIYRKRTQNLFSKIQETDEIKEDDEFDIPQGIEAIIHQLLSGLRNSNTIVRWSAAKGLARITLRLPRKFGDQIINSVLKLFSLLESDGIWNGACLAIAEFARFGLIRPESLDLVIPSVLKALEYDVMIGSTSVGTNVRDSACYVCWTLARSFEPDLLKNHVAQIASALLIMSCFDREVNCRRAASAAFQECVGRLGNIPHGIDIIVKADFFSLGQRIKSYTEIAPFIARFETYFDDMLKHLITKKLIHWDKSIRVVSSRSLGEFAKLSPNKVESLVDTFVKYILSEDSPPINRNGYILGLAEILLHVPSTPLVAQIIPTIESKRLYRGKQGELIREGACMLLEYCSRVKIALPEFIISEGSFGRKTKKKTLIIYQEVLDDNLKHPKEEISLMAANALSEFCKAYYVGSKDSDLVKRYLTVMEKETNPAVRRGLILALGKLPIHMIEELTPILNCLISNTKLENKVENRDAETRRNALNALVSLSKTLPKDAITLEIKNLLYSTFLEGTRDYSTDSRGDVGVIVRQASIFALEDFVTNFPPNDKNLWLDVIGVILKQSLEPMDQMREFAGESLARILTKSLEIPFQSEMMSICSLDWRDSRSTYGALIPLLKHQEYAFSIFSGIILSFSPTSHVKNEACSAILNHWKEISTAFEHELCSTIENYSKDDSFNFCLVNMLTLMTRQDFHPCEKILKPLIPYLADHIKSDDIVKVLNMIPLITNLAVNQNASLLLWMILVSPFPRVRKTQADLLLEKVKQDEVVNIITKVNWIASDPSISNAIENLKKIWTK